MHRVAVSLMMMLAFVLGGGGSGLAQERAAPFHGDIEKLAKQNRDFRRVLFTGEGESVVAGKALKLYTLYSPPQHPAGTVHHTKAEAEAAEAKHAR
jgi:hypothetical protein